MKGFDSGLRRLYLMQVAMGTIPTANQPLLWPVVCYLVQTAHGKNILIDSGTPADLPSPQGMPPVVPGKNVVEQLADLGLRPADIDVLICTHFDADHVGYHDCFTKAELVVQRAHYELARSGQPRYASARAHWDHPALHYRFVAGDTELLPGLTLVETSGHAPGHQSVLLRLPRTGAVLLASDAVVLRRLFTPDRRAWPIDDNEAQLRVSTRKLVELAERERVALVVFGHDGEQWQALAKAPDYYD